ncbi:hypothetical protein JOL62DRAFT_570389 [Phyllosticta paracitricarpa]|uniref:Secreted protein n=1 Tax=Phyllosticta paracitricarpa TaxID=2016321 RepID=A0ABR1NEC4_9PEZI
MLSLSCLALLHSVLSLPTSARLLSMVESLASQTRSTQTGSVLSSSSRHAAHVSFFSRQIRRPSSRQPAPKHSDVTPLLHQSGCHVCGTCHQQVVDVPRFDTI